MPGPAQLIARELARPPEEIDEAELAVLYDTIGARFGLSEIESAHAQMALVAAHRFHEADPRLANSVWNELGEALAEPDGADRSDRLAALFTRAAALTRPG